MIRGKLLRALLICFVLIANTLSFTPKLTVSAATDGQAIYVPVVAFPTVADNISWTALTDYWHGHPDALPDFQTANKTGPTLIATATTFDMLHSLLGAPATNVLTNVVDDDQLAATLWKLRPAALGIVPFGRVVPVEKTLSVDGTNALLPDADLSKYPLAIPMVDVPADATRDLSKLTVLVMTGTTAITRTMAYVMEHYGLTLPAADVLPFLADADFIHTSNELAFATDCPYPDPEYRAEGLVFCSRDKYFDLLKAIHLNIVELTGNHVNDWGTDAFSHTLDLYDQAHIATFGGGRTAESARAPLIIQHNGTTIALIGCNMAGPSIDWATDTLPGSAACDDDYLAQEIPKLKAAHDLVIMTIQYLEYDSYSATSVEIEFFQKYADLGADVVFGSQAHHPQGFGFGKGLGGAFIDYGTGNMFFDQMNNYEVRQMRMDKLIIYDGRLLGTLFFTGLREDYSHTPAMTARARAQFLTSLFKASGW